jgi:hypothetical protein
MKHPAILFAIALSSSVFAANATANDPHARANMSPMAAPKANLTQEATVLSSINQSQYTYIEVSQNKKPLWLAATSVAVKKGDLIRFDEGMIMTNFYSKSLKRTFPSITFVNQVVVSNAKK